MEIPIRRIIAIIIVLDILVTIAIVTIFINYRRSNIYEAESGKIFTMGTEATVKVLAPSRQTAQDCIEAATEQFNLIEKIFSDKRSDSQISLVNREAFKGPVKVSREVLELIQT